MILLIDTLLAIQSNFCLDFCLDWLHQFLYSRLCVKRDKLAKFARHILLVWNICAYPLYLKIKFQVQILFNMVSKTDTTHLGIGGSGLVPQDFTPKEVIVVKT